jgi:hypothetical protein
MNLDVVYYGITLYIALFKKAYFILDWLTM